MNQEALREAFTFSEQEFMVERMGRTAKGSLIKKKTGLPVHVRAVTKYGHLSFHWQGKHHALHRAVWTLCNGPIPPGLVIRHLNNDAMDNTIKNLAVGNQQENLNDRRKLTVRHFPAGWRASTTVSRCRVTGVNAVKEKAVAECQQKVNAVLETIRKTGHRYFLHSPEELRQMLHFDEITNTLTVKQLPPRCGKRDKKRLLPGTVLTSKDPRAGITLEGQTYTQYEIVYLMFVGQIPIDRTIHHIDFDATNNRPNNLMLLTFEENSKLGEGIKHFSSAEDFQGTARNKSGRFSAFVHLHGGGRVSLGAFATQREATEVAKEAHKAVLEGTFVAPHVHVEQFVKERFVESEIRGMELLQHYLAWCEVNKIPDCIRRKSYVSFWNTLQQRKLVKQRTKGRCLWFVNLRLQENRSEKEADEDLLV